MCWPQDTQAYPPAYGRAVYKAWKEWSENADFTDESDVLDTSSDSDTDYAPKPFELAGLSKVADFVGLSTIILQADYK